MKERKWYAVYTRPRWEKRVSELLTKKKINNYCPLNKVHKPWNERIKTLLEPLFSSYVFVQLEEGDYLSVLQTSGVINFVYWLNQPAIISEREISTVKNFLNEYSGITLQRIPVSFNTEVKVVREPLMLRKGNVLEVRNSTIKVVLPSIGYTLSAEVRKDSIESFSHTEELGLV